MTKSVTNYTPGPKGINLDDGSTVWVEPGQTLDIGDLRVKGDLPEFGKPNDQADKDAEEVVALRARVAELEAQLVGGKKPIALTGKSKDELLQIAKDEGVTVADDATIPQIQDAIKAKREAA